MIDYDPHNNTEPIIITAQTDSIQCARCGVWYPSRGIGDIGICRACERILDSKFAGGPLNGMRHSGLLEDDGDPPADSETDSVQEDTDD